MTSPKFSTCPGCNQVRFRSDYHTRSSDNSVYPLCRFCGNPGKRTIAERVCSCCGVSKPLRRDFPELRETGTRKYIGHTSDCRECRNANGVTLAQKAEAARLARLGKLAREDEKRIAPKPETRPVFDWKYNGRVYGESRV